MFFYGLMVRLKKEELASFARSADDVVKAVIESAKKDIESCARSNDQEDENDLKIVKDNFDRPKILISIQAQDGLKQFRMYKVGNLDFFIRLTNRLDFCIVDFLLICSVDFCRTTTLRDCLRCMLGGPWLTLRNLCSALMGIKSTQAPRRSFSVWRMMTSLKSMSRNPIRVRPPRDCGLGFFF